MKTPTVKQLQLLGLLIAARNDAARDASMESLNDETLMWAVETMPHMYCPTKRRVLRELRARGNLIGSLVTVGSLETNCAR